MRDHDSNPATNAALRNSAVTFRTGLVEYAGLLYSGQAREAELRRSSLSRQWTALADRLAAHGLRLTERHGRRPRPIFDTILFPVADRLVVPTRHDMTTALRALDAVIDALRPDQTVIERRFPARVTALWGMTALAALSSTIGAVERVGPISQHAWAWLTGHPRVVSEGVSLVIGLAGTISGGLFVHLIHQRGWRGSWKTYPLKATLYLLFLTLSALFGLQVPLK